MTDSTDELLRERQQTHGDFADHARCTQRLKGILISEQGHRLKRGQQALTMQQREALDMIMHKIGRILAGDADWYDHWDDIAGYAKLGKMQAGINSEPRSLSVPGSAYPSDALKTDQELLDKMDKALAEAVASDA